METQAPSVTSFSRIVLSDQQSLQGQSLNHLQRDVIQNHRADIAEEIINTIYDHKDKEGYALKIAYLQGQLSILSLQLAQSDAATKFINFNQVGE